MNSKINWIFIVFIFISNSLFFNAQTLIINEFSNGPFGAQEYIEFIVVDDNAFYDCGNTTPPCVDIRGWIIDDNNGYHGIGGVAGGCNRFSSDSFWQCIPLGTIITVYNDAERNISLPPDDISMSDNNCRLIIPINNAQLFDNNLTTPGAVACSYPSAGWVPGGNWTRIGMANTGDCVRLVNLAGCEVSSLCYGDVNLNIQVYFASGGSGADNIWTFSDGNSTIQANWSEGCADNETTLDAGTCGVDNQTPGSPNNALNSAFIAQFNNNCQPIQPLALTLTSSTSQSCTCDGSSSISSSGSIGPYTYDWYDNSNVTLNQTTASASNLCSGNYYCVVTSSIGCSDTIFVNVGSNNNVITPTFNAIAPICSGGSFVLPSTSSNGISGTWFPALNITTTTNYSFIPTVGQCATNATMTVEVNPTHSVNASRTVCTNQIPYLWNGVTFNGPGNQSATLASINNCDSTVNMTLYVSSTITSATNVTVCNSDLPYSWNGLTFNSAGSQSANFTATSGCDSLATLILQVANTLTSSSTISICPSDLPYSWNGLTFSSAGSQTANLQSIGGCDSLATLTLSLFPTYNEVENVTICFNETPYFWNGLSLSSTTSQTVTLSSINGCDSTVTLNLTVLPVYTITLDSIVCQNELPLIWNGLTFNAVGTQSLTLSALNGCDSSISMNVQVLDLPQVSITGGGVYCAGDVIQPIIINLVGSAPYNISYALDGVGATVTSNQSSVSLGINPGSYVLTLVSDQNCIQNLNLGSASIVINPIPSVPAVNSDSSYCLNYTPDTLFAIGNLNAAITWYDQSSLQNPIQSGKYYLPSNILGATTYYVVQEENGCVSAPNDVTITFENCDVIIPTAFTPDGDNVNDAWLLDGIDAIFPKNIVYIYNRWGNVIYQSHQGKYETNSWDGKYEEKQMPVGSYYFIIEFNDGQTQNKTGIVSIIK